MENIVENNEKDEYGDNLAIMLNAYQVQWLYEHGGRTLANVCIEDDKRLYVLMGISGGSDEKIYI